MPKKVLVSEDQVLWFTFRKLQLTKVDEEKNNLDQGKNKKRNVKKKKHKKWIPVDKLYPE